MRTNEDLTTIVTVIYLGMAVPLVLALRFHGLLELYVTGRHFAALAALGYGLVFWFLIAREDLDRVNVVLASIVFPVLGALVILFAGFAMTDLHEGFRYLFLDVDDLFVYAAAFGSAGIAAVALQRQTEQLASEHDRTPNPQTIPLALITILALGFLATGAAGHATANAAEVTDVEADTTYTGRPVLNVTVESEPTELLVSVTAPDDSSTTHRVSRADLLHGSATVQLHFWEFDDAEPQAGTYTVTVTALSGVTVDSATYTIESAPSPRLVETATAPGGEPLDINLPPDTIVYGPADDADTRVAVVLQNDGDVAAQFYVRLFTEDERIKSREIPLRAGQHGANIFDLSGEEVDRIHEDADGTVSIEIGYGDEKITTEVDLPDS